MPEDVQAPSANFPLDAQRFADQLPAWVGGSLPLDEAHWMAHMAEQHPDLAQEAQWLRDFRREVRAQVQSTDTQVAWGQLQQRISADAAATHNESPAAETTAATGAATAQPANTKAEPERRMWLRRRALQPEAAAAPAAQHRARQQRWWRSPVVGNALASVALAVVLGHTGWELWRSAASQQAQIEQPAWRAVALDDLAAATAAQQVAVQLPASASAQQWHAAVLALGRDVQVQPLADGLWQLTLPSHQPLAQWRAQLQAQPGMAQLQWIDAAQPVQR